MTNAYFLAPVLLAGLVAAPSAALAVHICDADESGFPCDSGWCTGDELCFYPDDHVVGYLDGATSVNFDPVSQTLVSGVARIQAIGIDEEGVNRLFRVDATITWSDTGPTLDVNLVGENAGDPPAEYVGHVTLATENLRPGMIVTRLIDSGVLTLLPDRILRDIARFARDVTDWRTDLASATAAQRARRLLRLSRTTRVRIAGI